MIKNQTRKVLLIDDDESFFNLINYKISKNNFHLLWAKDGKEGIIKANQEMPDLVITDIMMPRLNGFEILKRLKEKHKTSKLKFMVVTNYGTGRDTNKRDFLESLGICKYLIKSNHTPTEIVKEIQEAIG